MGMRMEREEGLTSLMIYVIIISIVAMLSLLVILNIFLMAPPPKSEVELRYFIDGEEIDRIVCTIEDYQGYARYDYKNRSFILDVLVLKDGKPVSNTWVTISGCGITATSSQTDSSGYAHFNIKDIYLPPNINKDRLTIHAFGHTFELPVIRG